MSVAFGFSAGGFVAAIHLIHKVSQALKDAGGASSAYQQVILELNGLRTALRHLEKVESTTTTASHVNAIRGMALACQIPLQEFLTKFEKYESSLGPFSRGNSFRGAGRKAGWALLVAGEVDKLRAMVTAKVVSINLLLMTHLSATITRNESQSQERHQDILNRMSQHQGKLSQAQAELLKTRNYVTKSQLDLAENFQKLRQEFRTSNKRLDNISSVAMSVQTSTTTLGNIGRQVLMFISTFPAEIRDLLKSIVQSNLQIYTFLLSSQANLSGNPTLLLQSNIHFEDALGRTRQLPFEWFCHWEAFNGLLLAEFKGVPGETLVSQGRFHILDLRRPGILVNQGNWSQSIFPGAKISMSMIISKLRNQEGICLRQSCNSGRITRSDPSGTMTCSECGIKCFPNLARERFSVEEVEEAEEVSQLQINEDKEIYGSRNVPTETQNFWEPTPDRQPPYLSPMDLARLPLMAEWGADQRRYRSYNTSTQQPVIYRRDTSFILIFLTPRMTYQGHVARTTPML